MKISQVLLNEDYPLKYFYCCIDNKEYILCGDDMGFIHDCSYGCDIGNIIIETLENKNFIYSTIRKYIDKISVDKYDENEIFNQEIVWNNLVDLQHELEKSNIRYFRYLDFPTYISKKFVENFNDINVLKEKYMNADSSLKKVKEILTTSSFGDTTSTIDMFKRIRDKYKSNINNLESLSFKSFTLDILEDFLNDFKIFELNLMIYSFKDFDLDITDKITGTKHINVKNPIQKIRLLQQNYNLNIFNNFYEVTCFSKLAICDKGKVYLDDEINNLDNKKLNLDMRIIEIFKINNLIELLNLSLIRIIDKKITITKCLNCGNYFIPENRSNEKYCNRISPQNPNKTCKEYGAKKTYRDEIKSTPIKYEHNRTSQFYRMRINRAKSQKEKNKYESIFNDYKENYQKNKIKYKSGKLKESDFVEWIKNQKITKE